MNVIMAVANKLLPDTIAGGNATRKGYESESELSMAFGRTTDQAATKNNEN